MFNSTSGILPYASPDYSVTGFILPHSDKVLTSEDIDRKIKRTEERIVKLTQGMPHRNTHGGKSFRAEKRAAQDQVSLASQRLKLLNRAKFHFIKKDTPYATQRIMSLINKSGKLETVGALSITSMQLLSIFDSPVFTSIDNILHHPQEVRNLITLVQIVKSQLNKSLENIVVLGDLYIFPKFRGHGYANPLIQKVCKEIFSTTETKFIAVSPDPFEYENGLQKSLHETPDYESKKARLITLYLRNGFVPCQSDFPVLYRTPFKIGAL